VLGRGIEPAHLVTDAAVKLGLVCREAKHLENATPLTLAVATYNAVDFDTRFEMLPIVAFD
jgi:hypothetical protein